MDTQETQPFDSPGPKASLARLASLQSSLVSARGHGQILKSFSNLSLTPTELDPESLGVIQSSASQETLRMDQPQTSLDLEREQIMADMREVENQLHVLINTQPITLDELRQLEGQSADLDAKLNSLSDKLKLLDQPNSLPIFASATPSSTSPVPEKTPAADLWVQAGLKPVKQEPHSPTNKNDLVVETGVTDDQRKAFSAELNNLENLAAAHPEIMQIGAISRRHELLNAKLDVGSVVRNLQSDEHRPASSEASTASSSSLGASPSTDKGPMVTPVRQPSAGLTSPSTGPKPVDKTSIISHLKPRCDSDPSFKLNLDAAVDTDRLSVLFRKEYAKIDRLKTNQNKIAALPSNMQTLLKSQAGRFQLIKLLAENNNDMNAVTTTFRMQLDVSNSSGEIYDVFTPAEIQKKYGCHDKAKAIMAAKVAAGEFEVDPNDPAGGYVYFLRKSNYRATETKQTASVGSESSAQMQTADFNQLLSFS